MIDAIRPVYSSIHGGRGQNLNHSQTFDRSVRGLGDRLIVKNANVKTPHAHDWGGLFFVSGGIAAVSFISDTLAAAGKSNLDPSSMVEITKHAGIWAAAGAAIFCAFKLMERICIGGK